MYYIKYNGVDLTDMVKVRSVEIPSLPSIEHSSINMFERNGNVFNGLSYNNREIELKLLIQTDNLEDYELYVSDVKRAFYTKEEAKLYCGDETLYMWCVPEGDMIITELGNCCAEVEISLIAYDPYWYSEEVNVASNNDSEYNGNYDDDAYNKKYDSNNKKKFTVKYDGDVPVYPILSIGFGKGTDSNKDGAYTFVQIENQTNGDRILIGGIPSTEGKIIKADTKVVSDPMEDLNGWSDGGNIDNSRAGGANFSLSNSECAFQCRDFGSTKEGYTWHGACWERTVQSYGKLTNTDSITDFKVRVRMNHNSAGVNNDPTHPYENEYKAGEEKKTKQELTYYYKVTPSALWLRKGPSTRYGKLCAMPKGTRLKEYDKTNKNNSWKNGWLKTTYNGKTGWCYSSYLQHTIVDNTVIEEGAEAQCNYVTNRSTAIRATPSKSAKNKKTIPASKCIRIYTGTKYCSKCNGVCKKTSKDKDYQAHKDCDKFYKMAKKYDGVSGYVLAGKDSEIPNADNDYKGKYLTRASNYCVEYDYEVDTADDKTGIIEIYGYAKDGTELFRMGMYDDNKYYEFTYPMIYRNSGEKNLTEFLVDKTQAPNAKTRTEYDSGGKKVQKVLSGKYGSWNEFYGELYIERVKNKWYAYVQKIVNDKVVKTIKSKKVTDKSTNGKDLYKLVIYSGTQDSDNASTMSISHIEVKTASAIDETVEFTCQEFEAGDVLEIDNSVPEVRLNGRERNDLIDVGSAFFALEPGDNKIKVASDDSVINVDVIWSDKKL